MKQSKAARITLEMLPEKVQQINKLIEDQEALNNELSEKRDYYLEAINKKIADNAEIEKLKMKWHASRHCCLVVVELIMILLQLWQLWKN